MGEQGCRDRVIIIAGSTVLFLTFLTNHISGGWQAEGKAFFTEKSADFEWFKRSKRFDLNIIYKYNRRRENDTQI